MPKFIFTANSFDGDEVFKCYAASKVELGIPYIIGQHGANYGSGWYAPSEVHEVSTVDRYLTWGWSGNNPKYCPALALPLVGSVSAEYNYSGGLLLVERGGGHRETIWDETQIFKEYLENQYEFVAGLQADVVRQTTVRLYTAYLYSDWSEDVFWKEKYPQIKLDRGVSKISELIRQSRLIVYSYESTGVLESLAQNIPTIFFYDTRHWPLRVDAQPYYEQLKRVGIFHENPESAANKINEIWNDVEGWWNNDDVQDVRRIFCDRFARIPENPILALKNALISTHSSSEPKYK